MVSFLLLVFISVGPSKKWSVPKWGGSAPEIWRRWPLNSIRGLTSDSPPFFPSHQTVLLSFPHIRQSSFLSLTSDSPPFFPSHQTVLLSFPHIRQSSFLSLTSDSPPFFPSHQTVLFFPGTPLIQSFQVALPKCVYQVWSKLFRAHSTLQLRREV